MGGKVAVLKLLEQLPEETTLEDIQYHLYVLQKIKAGQDAIDTGHVISHENVMRELAGSHSLVGCCER
jgi:predicted transcriptional regulator